jgi:hypothetical protein
MEIVNFPDNIKSLITNDFLTTFKERLDKLGELTMPENPTYWNFYQWFDGTAIFQSALKETCQIHHTLEIYKFIMGLKWYQYDILAARFTEMLYENDIIEEGNLQDIYSGYDDKIELLGSM